MTALRIIVAALGVALTGAIVWASVTGDLHGNIFEQGGVLLTLPWGVVAMVDLYVGFAFFAIIVFLTERSLIAGLLWALPIFVLGNIWTAVWLLFRLPRLADRLSRPDWPNQ
jgi:predicted membrane-bound dolichyl-phosphate-mannose-protein mannosyltransferase